MRHPPWQLYLPNRLLAFMALGARLKKFVSVAQKRNLTIADVLERTISRRQQEDAIVFEVRPCPASLAFLAT